MSEVLENLKLCRDCKWLNRFRVKWMFEHPRCYRLDILTGLPVLEPQLCEYERTLTVGNCGPEAKFFEPK
jgi:hypothetical protein